ALARADHGQRDAGVARGRLEDRLAGADRPLLLGRLAQRAGDPVLDRAGGVVRFELGPDAHARLGRESLELDERRVADRLHDVAVAPTARPVSQTLPHFFTKYSQRAEACRTRVAQRRRRGPSARGSSEPSAWTRRSRPRPGRPGATGPSCRARS